jgi:hypothetical protein
MIKFRTDCHPLANGRHAVKGDQLWTFSFTLEDGSTLKIEMGKRAHDAFKSMLEQEQIDDLADSDPKDN